MPIGGFSLADALKEYENVAGVGYNIRQRNRRIQDQEAEDKNPLPEFMLNRQKFQQGMGPDYTMQPGSPEEEALLNLGTVRNPGARDILRERGREVPTIVKQKRKMDLKQELAEAMQKFSVVRAKNAMTAAALDDPKNLIDPATKKLMKDAHKSQEMEILQAYQRSLRMGYGDVWGDPDVQDMVQQAIISGLLGTTSSGAPALGGGATSGGFQMPDTQLPQLQTRGLLGGIQPPPGKSLIEMIDDRRGRGGSALGTP
jgi:hypothetical protein